MGKKAKKIKKTKEKKRNAHKHKTDAVSGIRSSSGPDDKYEIHNDIESEEKAKKSDNNEKEKKNADKDGLLFRCVYTDCVSAFERMHELMRHIKQSHKEYQACPKKDSEFN